MNKHCKEYLRLAGNALRCSRQQRKRLLAGLAAELDDAFPPENPSTMTDLIARFGTPETMAAELERALPYGTATEYQTKRRKKWMAATAACAVIIALLAGYLAWLGDIDVYVPPQNEKITYVED